MVGNNRLLVGLSLLFGLMTRARSLAAILLMILYRIAHMDWPNIPDANTLIVDEYIIHALVWRC